MLEIRALTKRYAGTLAVDHVSFHIRPGEILGYVGPNGAGKNSTVKMIIGLLDPTDGQILFRDRSIHEDLAAFQSRIGYVPEEPYRYLYPYLSAYEYLELTGRLRGMPVRRVESEELELEATSPTRSAHSDTHRSQARCAFMISGLRVMRSTFPIGRL